jgi:hypothetical protein
MILILLGRKALRDVPSDQESLNTLLRQKDCRAAALIFHEKCPLGFTNQQRSDIRVSELLLLTPNRLLPLMVWIVFVPAAIFHTSNKKQTTNNRRQTRQ